MFVSSREGQPSLAQVKPERELPACIPVRLASRGRPPVGAAVSVIAVLLFLHPVVETLTASDPLALFGPALKLGSKDRRTVDAGEALVKVLPADQRDVALIGVARTGASGERLMAWMRHVDELYRGRYVSLIGRFSNPPRIEDLAALELDDRDLDSLRTCEAGDCELKLNVAEMSDLKAKIVTAGAEWKPVARRAFRQIVLARAQAFLEHGLTGMTYDDETPSVSLASEFFSVASAPDSLGIRFPALVDGLRRFPAVTYPVKDFLYWSKQELGAKPIISVTHVSVAHRPGPRVGALAAARQVFATHYVTASLSFTAIVEDQAGAPAYLVYENRSRVDLLDGPFASLRRMMVERRLRSEGPRVLDQLRQKLESGNPEIVAY
jgi:hypothetical protein